MASSLRLRAREARSPISEFDQWPRGEQPNGARVFAHNELIIPAPPERVWDLLIDAHGWPEFYANAWSVELADPQQRYLQDGSVFRWVTLYVHLTSEVDTWEPPSRIGWRWWRRGAHGYHIWLLEPHECGTRIVTEETQRGVLPGLTRPIMQPALRFAHGHWLRQLARQVNRPPLPAGAQGAVPQP
ncbi:MAG: SRPBCC family protein [Pseudonocardiaceae bacterium]